MNNNLVLLSILCHLLGDYYLQNDLLAEKKKKHLKWNIVHGILYASPFFITFLFIKKNLVVFNIFFVIILSHFFVDLGKFYFLKLYEEFKSKEYSNEITNNIKKYITSNTKDWIVYILDQLIHLTIIFYCCSFFKGNVKYISLVNMIFNFASWNDTKVLEWLLVVIICYKPSNVTFTQLFSSYKPIEENTSERSIKKAGEIIGFLERILIVIFLSLKQYSAIGLIMTAKSIARYDVISKKKDFAEYYLIGTLVSILLSIIIYTVLLI